MQKFDMKNSSFQFSNPRLKVVTFEVNDELTNEQINDLLRINGAAVLYSYLRPIVSNLTNNSALPVLNLPFIDFTESK